MKRYNSFNRVHKGLRAFLYDTALKLQQADLSDRESSQKVIEQLHTIIDLFEVHAHHEDHFFNEPLEKVNPTVATLFVNEHEEDHRLSTVLRNQLQEWNNAGTTETRSTVGLHLFYSFNEFMAFNLYHMNKEEITLNQALWNVYSDEQIVATEQALVQSVPPKNMIIYIKWMIRGCSDVEIISWMTGVRDHAPAPVYELVRSTAAYELDPLRWKAITKEIESSIHA
jgi:Hemerythrin HHE cation binding domain